MIDLALDNSIFIDTQVQAALQELDMLFETDPTELIGYPTYGTDFEQFLWQTAPSPKALKNYIIEHINRYTFFCQLFDMIVDVNVVEGDYRNIYNVTIILRPEQSNKTAGFRIYQLR